MPRAVREREMLVEATRVFAELGFHAASMDEIAQRAGISKPMLYLYFESKEGLWRSCVAAARRRLIESIDEAVETSAPPDVQLWQGVQAFFAFVEEQRDSWVVLGETRAGPLSGELAEGRRQVARGVSGLLREAAAAEGAGEAALQRTDPLARTLVGAGESLANWWLEDGDLSRDAVALLLMNFAWLGFGDLVRGKRWRPGG